MFSLYSNKTVFVDRDKTQRLLLKVFDVQLPQSNALFVLFTADIFNIVHVNFTYRNFELILVLLVGVSSVLEQSIGLFSIESHSLVKRYVNRP
jgi:hypothetical protein